MARTARDMEIVKITVGGVEIETFQYLVDSLKDAEQSIQDAKLEGVREEFTAEIKESIANMLVLDTDSALSMDRRQITVTFGMKNGEISITEFESVKKRIKRD